MEEVVAKRNVCHKAWRKSQLAEDKHTLDVAKNCFRIAREGKDVISVCCIKYDVGNVVSDADCM